MIKSLLTAGLGLLLLSPESLAADCGAQSFNNANWPATAGGSYATGVCASAYSGSPKRFCNADGTWASLVTEQCQRNFCPAVTEQNAKWGAAYALYTVFGTCNSGYSGRPSRNCKADGTWGGISSPCQANSPCPSQVYNRALWPETPSGQVANGKCDLGFVGSPKRNCQAGGVWSEVVQDICSPVPPTTPVPQAAKNCPAENYGNAAWPQILGGNVANGVCAQGHLAVNGGPKRECMVDGTWESLILDNCKRITCTTEYAGFAIWPESSAGDFVKGTCDKGFGGNPSRTCNIDGTWGPVDKPCLADADCPFELFNRANWPSVRSGEYSMGVCVPGYDGQPKRMCGPGGVWSTLVEDQCSRNQCPQTVVGNVILPVSPTSSISQSRCVSPFVGNPRAPYSTCNPDGTWGTPYGGECATGGNCPKQCGYARADFPATAPGSYAVGQCNPGFKGRPVRYCKPDGTWASLVNFHCTFA